MIETQAFWFKRYTLLTITRHCHLGWENPTVEFSLKHACNLYSFQIQGSFLDLSIYHVLFYPSQYLRLNLLIASNITLAQHYTNWHHFLFTKWWQGRIEFPFLEAHHYDDYSPGGGVESRNELHCSMHGYLWPLTKRMALPQIIPSGRAVTCCSSHMNGNNLHANRSLHASWS